MKRVILSFLVMLSLCSYAQSIGDAFYVYRNDGYFNVLYRSEIDSMTYSNYDVDSIFHEQISTQVIYTKDSTYCIPINAIDSVSFVTPSTIYKQGVVVMDEKLRPYVISHDSLSFTMNTNVPEKIIPKVGDRIVTTTMDDLFPAGFAGEVRDIKHTEIGIEVECSSVSLSDLFERYFGVSNKPLSPSTIRRRTSQEDASGENVIFAPGVQKFDLLNLSSPLPDGMSVSYEIGENFAVGGNMTGSMGVTFTPVIRGRTDIIVSPQVGIYVCFSIVGDFHLEEKCFLGGKIEASANFPFFYSPPVYIPYSPLVFFNIELGGFIKASCEAACQNVWKQDYRSHFFWEYCSKGKNLNPQNKILPKEKSTSREGWSYVKGSIGGGAYIEVGFDLLVKDIATARHREEIGVEYINNYVLTKKDLEQAKTSTATYEKLRDSQWTLNLLTQLSFNASVLNLGISQDINAPLFNNRVELLSGSHVPTIEEFRFPDCDIHPEVDGLRNYKVKVKGKCSPVNIGFIAFDEEGNRVPWFSETWLQGYTGKQEEEKFSNFNLQYYHDGILHTFESGHIYTIYPIIMLLNDDKGTGYLDEILASPSAAMIMYTIKCPDDNHPHAIDLGLPSGTKWACCNLGASAPIEYGGYYAWGETAEKAEYRPGNYKFSKEEGQYWIIEDRENNKNYYYLDIGDDISGTQYDAATMLWGSGWCLPTYEQCEELRQTVMGNYRGELKHGDRVRYITFCNPDSAHVVILPPQGYKYYSSTEYEGQLVEIWSSTSEGLSGIFGQTEYGVISEAYEHYGNARNFGYGLGYLPLNEGGNKHCGLAIRPVRREK